VNWHPSVPRLDDELTAMAWYLESSKQFTTTTIESPTLHIRVAEALTESDGDASQDWSNDSDWRAHWHLPHAVMEVPGNHFTMMGECADFTARAIHSWLATTLPSMARDARVTSEQ
jgi:hypothetical protein